MGASINALFARARRFLGADGSARRFIAVQSSGLYTLRISSKVINFGIAILLARWLGQASFGVYTLAFAWAGMLVTPALLGMDRLGMREVSQGYIEKNWGLVKAFLVWSFSRAIKSSLVVAALMAGISFWAYHDEPAIRNAFLTASLLIPPTVLVRRLQSAHDGFKNMVLGRLPDMLLQPVVFVVCVAWMYWFLPDYFSPASVLGLYFGTTVLFSWSITSWLLKRIIPNEVLHAQPEGDTKAWNKSSIIFLAITFMFVADSRASILLLGALSSKSDVAIYGTLTRVVDILPFLLASLGAPVSRLGLQYYRQGEHKKLQRLLTRTARLVTLIGLPFGVLLILFGRQYLMIFGSEYLPGYPGLILLTLGEIINLATGLSGVFLSMTKHETTTAKIVSLGLALNLTLGWLLIPRFGIMGAAISEISSIAFRCAGLSFLTWKIVGVDPTAFGFTFPKNNSE